jgi:hypothetical protein
VNLDSVVTTLSGMPMTAMRTVERRGGHHLVG